MNRRFSASLLFSLRNQVAIAELIRDRLQLPCKLSEGLFRFLCPLCAEFHTATNPRTNLARCFRCRRNFNTIDLLMLVDHCTFVEAVMSLRRLLPDDRSQPASPTVSSGQTTSGAVK